MAAEHRRGWHPERFELAANAEKGFEAVHLVEASDDVGGRMRWVRRLPTLGDWGRIVGNRKVMLSKLRNVEVVTGRELSAEEVRDYGAQLSAEEVRDYGAQLVVVATGSRWSAEGLQSSIHEPIEGASRRSPTCSRPSR